MAYLRLYAIDVYESVDNRIMFSVISQKLYGKENSCGKGMRRQFVQTTDAIIAINDPNAIMQESLLIESYN